MYSGKHTKKPLCVFELLDIEDDMLVDNPTTYIEPNTCIKISVNPTRIIHYVMEYDVTAKKRKKVYFQLDWGKKTSKRQCLEITTKEFLETIKNETEVFQHLNVNDLLK